MIILRTYRTIPFPFTASEYRVDRSINQSVNQSMRVFTWLKYQAAVRSAKISLLRDFCFNAIHCDRSVSTCE